MRFFDIALAPSSEKRLSGALPDGTAVCRARQSSSNRVTSSSADSGA
jgi:hypothetical protein